MKVKTSELNKTALDWAVGQADECDLAPVEYSTKWEFGGQIIEREKIELKYLGYTTRLTWGALIFKPSAYERKGAVGSTPLIAAMRCYVASKLGEEVEVPDELLQGESK